MTRQGTGEEGEEGGDQVQQRAGEEHRGETWSETKTTDRGRQEKNLRHLKDQETREGHGNQHTKNDTARHDTKTWKPDTRKHKTQNDNGT